MNYHYVGMNHHGIGMNHHGIGMNHHGIGMNFSLVLVSWNIRRTFRHFLYSP